MDSNKEPHMSTDSTQTVTDVYATPESRVSTTDSPLDYAGFWIRVAALLIDYVVLMIPMMIVTAVLYPIDSTGLVANLVTIPAMWLYFALMESGSGQATLGKRAVGLKVVDINGEPIGFGKATGRYFAKIISALVFYLGFIWVGFDSRKQGWHDKMAGTLVVRR
jgi:uncharacterized RDD family membrane protein YckC